MLGLFVFIEGGAQVSPFVIFRNWFVIVFVKQNIMDIVHSQTKKIIEELVGKRFNIETLQKYLTEKFNYSVTLDDISKEDDELSDYNLITNIDIEYPDGFHLFADIDIYFLKMRREGFDGSDIYITEVAVEFE